MLKDSYKAFEKALHVLAIIELQVTAVTVRETQYKIFCFMVKLPVLDKISSSEISLPFTRPVL